MFRHSGIDPTKIQQNEARPLNNTPASREWSQLKLEGWIYCRAISLSSSCIFMSFASRQDRVRRLPCRCLFIMRQQALISWTQTEQHVIVIYRWGFAQGHTCRCMTNVASLVMICLHSVHILVYTYTLFCASNVWGNKGQVSSLKEKSVRGYKVRCFWHDRL